MRQKLTRSQARKLAAAIAAAGIGGWARSGLASVSYKYITDQTSYPVAAGGNVTVQIYLQEILTGNSTSLITADGGLFNAGFLVTGGGANGGAFQAAVGGNSTSFPVGGFGGFSPLGPPYSNNSARGGENTVDPTTATSGPTPVGGLIPIGTLTVTAGTPGNSTSFNLGAVPTSGNVSGGYTQTFGNSQPSGPGSFYDLDVSESSPNPYTGVGNTLTPFTVTVTADSTPNMYWKGAADGKWNTSAGNVTNWRTDPTSNIDTQAIPTSLTDVFLTAASASNISNMSLGQDFAINSLSFTTGASSVNLQPGNTVTLNAANAFIDSGNNSFAAGTGLVVPSGSAAHTIGANIALATSQTWQINNLATNPLTVSGTVSGSGASLTKAGNGTLVLSGNNTLQGVIINAGTLRANNAIGSATGGGNVTVNSGGTLGGNGTIANTAGNTVTINSGGTITAGVDATTNGKLAANAEVWNGGGKYLWTITGNGTGTAGGSGANSWDLLTMSSLSVTGNSTTPFTIALSGNTTIPIGAAGITNNKFIIAQASTGNVTVNSGAFALDTSGFKDFGITPNSSAFTLAFVTDTNNASLQDLTLTYNATPEPGTAMLFVASGLPLLMPRRRRPTQQAT